VDPSNPVHAHGFCGPGDCCLETLNAHRQERHLPIEHTRSFQGPLHCVAALPCDAARLRCSPSSCVENIHPRMTPRRKIERRQRVGIHLAALRHGTGLLPSRKALMPVLR
jgi:hypothetical protein